MSNQPFLAPFESGTPIILTPMPNGGWVVEQSAERGIMPKPLGAFGAANDMIAALTAALNQPT